MCCCTCGNPASPSVQLPLLFPFHEQLLVSEPWALLQPLILKNPTHERKEKVGKNRIYVNLEEFKKVSVVIRSKKNRKVQTRAETIQQK
jgi:hypothetical protein